MESSRHEPWDDLIVTASTDDQAAAYERRLALRQELGLLTGPAGTSVREVLVVTDPGGKRVGSGGSTLHCLARVLEARGAGAGGEDAWLAALRDLRILIVHAGGDSKRLPAYRPCGKLFLPVPCDSDSALGATLFDRQIGTYLDLPAAPPGRGQTVIASGDVLLTFDAGEVRFDAPGLTGLGALASPEDAARHGVYCARGGTVEAFLQKPSPEAQREHDAIDRYGQSILDIGVMSFDAATAVAMLQAFGYAAVDGRLESGGEPGRAVFERGLDFYREIACALGDRATAEQYVRSAQSSGSTWPDPLLRSVFDALRTVRFSVQVLPHCEFLHFGTTRQLITSGLALLRADRGVSRLQACLKIGNEAADDASISGANAWVEGCRVRAPLELAGRNVLIGADVERSTALPPGACMDLLAGDGRDARPATFLQFYGIDDSFKQPGAEGATLCGRPVTEWLAAVGLAAEDVWPAELPAEARTLWDARLFPAVAGPAAWADWLWVFDPERADPERKRAYRDGDRYSPAEIADATDHDAFHARRGELRAGEVRRSLRRLFRPDSGFSADDLAHALGSVDAPGRSSLVAELLAEARWHADPAQAADARGAFALSRILHTLGSAVASAELGERLDDAIPRLAERLEPAERAWLDELDLSPRPDTATVEWCDRARAVAFESMNRTIIAGAVPRVPPPKSALRSDEIVWGRAPARLDLGGGWSDTPPYSLEHGGCVLNAAVDLNGQPPIHSYARVIAEPVIRIASIDTGARAEIRELPDLLDYREATSTFALAKAALALSGFSPETADWSASVTLADMLKHFGGGLELTTLAAIPKGSGLGTSSIMGAVLLAVVQRVLGRELPPRELFHGVLRLEQALTTGGGWQDQVGGAVEAVKIASSAPGLVPDARIHYVPADVLDPHADAPAGRAAPTLLYSTGITRLAKNILQQVVGRYLDRDRPACATLRRIHALPPQVADAMQRKDAAAFGAMIDAAWRLNKRLDPNSTNPAVEALIERVAPHVHGAKLLGAGGGGFLLMVCKSATDAAAVRETLDADPPNERARFFEFSISREGLVVTIC